MPIDIKQGITIFVYSAKRKDERRALENASFFKSVVTSLVPMIPVIASVSMFLGYILTGNDLSAPDVS